MDCRYFVLHISCLLSFICNQIVHGMRIPWRSGRSDIIIQHFPFPFQKFQCLDGKLINLSQMCDGYKHCADDELWCSDCSTGTKSGAFSCRIGSENKCITPTQMCDGIRDCDTGIDEHGCEMQLTASTLGRRKRMQKESRNKDIAIVKTSQKTKRYEIPCYGNAHYCWHGGKCYFIDTPVNRFCLCNTGYEGPRCMHLSPSDYSSY